MAKSGDRNHGPGPVLDIYPDPNETQPNRPYRRPEALPQLKEISTAKKPPFGFGSLILLIVLIWGAEWIGTTLPGPFDDMLYEATAALFFGFIQYIRSLLYKK